MSIVEKAAERLKAEKLRSASDAPTEQPVAPQVTPHARGSTIERIAAERFERPLNDPRDRIRVDWEKVRRAGYLADGEAGERLTDELRRIKWRLLASVQGPEAKHVEFQDRIMVTSAAVGEGKTFTAINLAVSLANERDLEVVLVDADIPKRDVSRLFELDSRPGLMDALTDKDCQPEPLLVRTQTPNLMILPAGQFHEMAAELLNSRRMGQVIQAVESGGPRRLLVFDSPPLLATAEAPVLASYMGKVLVVVAAERTPQHTVKAAIETLGNNERVNLVLNMARLPSGENYYYRYYGREHQGQ